MLRESLKLQISTWISGMRTIRPWLPTLKSNQSSSTCLSVTSSNLTWPVNTAQWKPRELNGRKQTKISSTCSDMAALMETFLRHSKRTRELQMPRSPWGEWMNELRKDSEFGTSVPRMLSKRKELSSWRTKRKHQQPKARVSPQKQRRRSRKFSLQKMHSREVNSELSCRCCRCTKSRKSSSPNATLRRNTMNSSGGGLMPLKDTRKPSRRRSQPQARSTRTSW